MLKRAGFTMIELVFVIVVLGILAAIAIPRFAATRDDAQIAKGRSDVAAIRAGIVSERQSRLLTGQSNYITHLDSATANSTGQSLFEGNTTAVPPRTVLMYGITSANGNGHWMKSGDDAYTYMLMDQSVTFNYTFGDGKFTCNRAAGGKEGEYCRLLID